MTHMEYCRATGMLQQGLATCDDDDDVKTSATGKTQRQRSNAPQIGHRLRRIKRRAVIAAESQSLGLTTHKTLFLWLPWQRAPDRQGSSR